MRYSPSMYLYIYTHPCFLPELGNMKGTFSGILDISTLVFYLAPSPFSSSPAQRDSHKGWVLKDLKGSDFLSDSKRAL